MMQFELDLSPEDEAFRDEVRTFLERNLPPKWGTVGYKPWSNEEERGAFLRDWQYRLYKARLVAIAWPEEYGGRNATVVQQLIYNREMNRRRAPELLNRPALTHIGPTILHLGTDWQRQRFLPKMLSGEEIWCQMTSEPDAGSDLASLRTRAVGDGEDFLATGTKIWTSRAHLSDWASLMARTNPEAPKHHGITYFLVSMKTPGITIRPLRQIGGMSEFNQIFLDGVRIPRTQIVGEVNEGWRVATTHLNFERSGLSETSRIERRFEILVKLAKETVVDGKPRIDDPLVRDQLARFEVLSEALKQIGLKTILAGLRGRPPGPESAIGKLLTTETDQAMANYGLDLLGPYGVLTQGSPHAVKGGNAALSYLILRAATIGGGTSEIQRNLIGERVLGLPR
jgi:alkylation response protein AidB-like acyl-CoA dehydrogenase